MSAPSTIGWGLSRPPAPWRQVESHVLDALGFVSPSGLGVILSRDEIAGRDWIHVSVSRKGRMPDYGDLALVKRVFIGDDMPAYQVFPKKAEHRNFHNFCLHLWACPSGDPFPDPLGELMATVAP